MNAPIPKVISGGGRPLKYVLADGTRVPSCSTIASRFKEAGGLIAWAYQRGVAGEELYEKRDAAALSGGIAHDMIEGWLLGKSEMERPDDVPAEQWKHAINAYKQFRAWVETQRIQVTHTEMPLISERHRFGGTLDAIGRLPDGTLALLDWKTSGGVYADYLVQLGGYSLLWQEHSGEQVQAAQLARFDRDVEASSHRVIGRSVLDVAEQQFLRLLEAYRADATLKKAVR